MQPLRSYPLDTVLETLAGDFTVEGKTQGKTVDKLRPVGEADATSLSWIDPARADKQALLDATRAGAVVCDASLTANAHGTVLIKVANPRLTFIQLAQRLFGERAEPGVHLSAVIHPGARIGDGVHIGPLCTIGDVVIGDGCVIHSGVQLYDGVKLGRNVTLQSGCVIGVRAFSLAKDEQGDWHHMPHVGGVIIEDDVEIQALGGVDRGTRGDTVIGAGVLINSAG